MALCAIGCIAGLECLGAVMALAAILACIHVSHGVLATLLHREDLGVAVIALQALVSMDLAVKYNLACAAACILNVLSRRHCEGASHECHNHQNYYCEYCFLHLLFLLMEYLVTHDHSLFAIDYSIQLNYESAAKTL
jgi:hypothetical protein